MADIIRTFSHAVGIDQATQRMHTLCKRLRNRYSNDFESVTEYWEGSQCTFTFTARGMRFRGAIHVFATAVQVELTLPFLALMQKRDIEQRLSEEVVHCLSEPTR